jgi:EAL domain-containing protein (putative c-di-GMP-specific phosphodiesterase class I)
MLKCTCTPVKRKVDLIFADKLELNKSKRDRGTTKAGGTGVSGNIRRPETPVDLMVQQLRQALTRGELYLHYQPQYNTEFNEIEAFEALLRWRNPVLGTLPPDMFIKTAEETGLIIPIGEWVLRTACQFIRRIHQAGSNACRIAVNVSVAQVGQENFVERVLAILQETGLESAFLELELTELLPQGALDRLNERLQALKAREIRIALDDFGTGYASLSCLNQLRVDTLKIDKSFINGILEQKESGVLTRSIIGIGRELGLTVIAEGVENAAQVSCLTTWGCPRIQGYFYSEPVNATAALRMIKAGFSARPSS